MPGLAEHGVGFKDLADAIALRNRVLLQLERASIHPDDPAELGFVFVGAGYAGVEALAELNDMAHAALRSYPTLREVPQRWVLVDAAPKILPEIPRGLGEYASRRLEQRGVEIHVGTTLESYDGTEAVLANGTRIPARTLVWTAGVRASPLLPDLGLPLDERGRVVVDETLRVEGSDAMWALGDCAAVKNVKTPGVVDPPTCQHALRQARRLAKNLTGDAQAVRLPHARPGRDARPLQGHRGDPGPPPLGLPGLVRDADVPPVPAPAALAEAAVVVDWTVALFFRRDIVELSMLGHAQEARRVATAATSARPSATAFRRAHRRTGRRAARHGRARRPS